MKKPLFFCFLITGICLAQNHGLPVLPSGPPGAGPFGAYYARLQYTPDWDRHQRVSDHPDVVVRFENGSHRFVFWRGTSFIPCWVTDTGIWYTNEFVERRGDHSPNTEGCVEPMSDKQCRYSHVRIIESHGARVVVHWRYAPCDVHYEHPFMDPVTGWFDWVDEYYTIYPDASGVRKTMVHSSGLDSWIEFQECIVVNQPGTLPDDNIEREAVSVANMLGQHKTYAWDKEGGPEFDENPPRSNIIKVNLKATRQPFAIVPPPRTDGNLITPYGGHSQGSIFNWWDHWPVSQDASDGRRASNANHPSHSSLAHIGLSGHATAEWEPYQRGENWMTKLMLHGLTDKSIDQLVPLAKSWLNPPAVEANEGKINSEYDPEQMAYTLEHDGSKALKMEIKASQESPLTNPAFVILNWGEADAALFVNGEEVQRGGFRCGHRAGLAGSDLIVWIEMQATRPVSLMLMPVANRP